MEETIPSFIEKWSPRGGAGNGSYENDIFVNSDETCAGRTHAWENDKKNKLLNLQRDIELWEMEETIPSFIEKWSPRGGAGNGSYENDIFVNSDETCAGRTHAWENDKKNINMMRAGWV